jgi:hypothetical protein
MGEAKRRAAAGYARRRDEVLRVFNQEAGRLYTGFVIRINAATPVELRPLVWDWATGIQQRFTDTGVSALCISCEAEFPPAIPDALLVVKPGRDDSTTAILSGVCAACGAKHSDEELFNAWIADANRAGNSIRQIPPPELWHAGGRA